jgi:hypothetical protein
MTDRQEATELCAVIARLGPDLDKHLPGLRRLFGDVDPQSQAHYEQLHDAPGLAGAAFRLDCSIESALSGCTAWEDVEQAAAALLAALRDEAPL